MGTQHYAALQIHYPSEPFDDGGGKTMMSRDHWETIAVFDLGKDYYFSSWVSENYNPARRPDTEHDMSPDGWPDESYDQCNYRSGTTVPDPATWKRWQGHIAYVESDEPDEMRPPTLCLVAAFNALPEGRRRVLWWQDQ
jgi:hypothetical protein